VKWKERSAGGRHQCSDEKKSLSELECKAPHPIEFVLIRAWNGRSLSRRLEKLIII
jgi:hypothetical protein